MEVISNTPLTIIYRQVYAVTNHQWKSRSQLGTFVEVGALYHEYDGLHLRNNFI